MRLGRVVADECEACARLGEAPGRPGGLAERARADDEHDVVGSQPLPQAWAVRRQNAREQAVVLREAGVGAEGLLEDRCGEAFRQLDERLPRLGPVRARAHDERRRASALEERCQLLDRPFVDCMGSQYPSGRCVLALEVGFLQPVVHGHDDDGRATRRDRFVVGAVDGAGNVLGADGLVDPDRIVAREAA